MGRRGADKDLNKYVSISIPIPIPKDGRPMTEDGKDQSGMGHGHGGVGILVVGGFRVEGAWSDMVESLWWWEGGFWCVVCIRQVGGRGFVLLYF